MKALQPAFRYAAVLLSALFLLSACKEGPAQPQAAKAAAVPVSTAAIDAEAKGFVVGTPMSTRTVYVFFDPQCPHCAALWRAAKPLKSQAKFVWIPVGLMNKTSLAQGASLLASKDPVTAMDEHEVSMTAKQGGIGAVDGSDAFKATVEKNTELLNRFGFGSIPTIVAKHAQTGALVTKEGGMPTAELAAFLGLQPPAAN
ncbi:MAG TPA: thioredoxin fold domain-containing protein [Ramlibacter sp.]|nr:thioredoxin fold domain-containing protein [Ramlibacter sp.]